MSTVVTKKEARKIVAANLQSAAEQKGVQQADIARAIQRSDEELQTARQRVYRYFNALADIVGDDLANIAEFLDVSVARILDSKPKKNSRRAG